MIQNLKRGFYGLTKDQLRDAFAGPGEHHMELVTIMEGIRFVNDSRSTNVNSAWFALEQTVGPIVWIAGGIDKGNDYEPILALVRDKVKAIIHLGTDGNTFDRAFSDSIIAHVTNMKDAVVMAKRIAVRKDTVLLSPACASFDLFENYVDRGEKFKKEVCA